MIEALARNCDDFGIMHIGLDDVRQGIVHVVGPERFHAARSRAGVRQPHTSTHGAFGAVAVGIGTSELEHALVTQTVTHDGRGRCGAALTAHRDRR
jgi:3-isopropylmalate/(R)-2-methylmalate dehydratase large subunit